MQKIVLDVIPSGIQPRVYVDQYDLGRQFQITFKEGMGDYAFAPGTIIKINGRKSDGHVFEYTESSKWDATHYVISKSGSGSSTVVTISTTEQMTAAAGDADVQLTLQNSAGAVIGTLNFIMVVQMRPSAAGDPSETDLPDIVRSVNNILPDADGNVQLGPAGDGIGASNISTVEPTRTMRTAYPAGSYVYVTADDQLYYVTSPIGSGGTLTPGTNAVACTITSHLTNKVTVVGLSGNQNLASLKTWCKNNETVSYLGNTYFTETGEEGWSTIFISNKRISANHAQIVIWTNKNMYFLFTSNLSQTTPTWTTNKVALTAV